MCKSMDNSVGEEGGEYDYNPTLKEILRSFFFSYQLRW